MPAQDYLAYLAYVNADIKRENERIRAEMRRMRGKH